MRDEVDFDWFPSSSALEVSVELSNSTAEDVLRNSSNRVLPRQLTTEEEITGRATSCTRAEQRDLYSSTKTVVGIGGKVASFSSQELSTHGQSSLCPLSSFKLNTKAALSTVGHHKK